MRRFIFFLLIFTVLTVNARQITPDEALVVASEFLGTNPETPTEAPRKVVGTADRSMPFYIFNASDNAGFVIISGDTRGKKILAYSDTGSLDPNNLPPQLDWLLSEYAQEINSIQPAAKADISWSSSSAKVGEDIILETAAWGQQAPYNLLCPITNEHKTTLTGCTATAMAIVMKYHNFPERGVGTHKYHQESFDLTSDFECDFGATSFQWDLMLDSYTDQSSEDAKLAVATLMKSTAISINSHFGCGSTGAHALDIVGALRNHFYYDYSCQSLARNTFTDDEWTRLIVNEIKQGRPIIYEGHSSNNITEGHTWVLDGYSETTGLFHFNWGWDGNSNGFFALSGTGDNANLYPTDQKMIINIAPSANNQDNYSRLYIEYPHRLINYDSSRRGGLTVDTENIETRRPFKASVNDIIVPPLTDATIGLALVDERGNVKEVSGSNGLHNSLDRWEHFNVVFNRTFHGEIKATDRIQVVEYTETNSGDYQNVKFLTGTINAPSSIPVTGNKPNVIDVRIECDENLSLSLFDFGTGNEMQYHSGDVLKITPGTEIKYEITANAAKPDHGITYTVYDCFQRFNQVSMTESEADKVVGCFTANSQSTTFTARYRRLSSDVSVSLDTPGSLIELIDMEDAQAIRSMSLNGKIDASDIWYIGEAFQSLEELDLTNAEIVASDNKTTPDFGDNIPSVQSENKLPEYSFYGMMRLKAIMLPESLETIGTASFMDCNLSALRIPGNVNMVYAWMANGNKKLDRVYCSAQVPPVVYSIPLFVGTSCFTDGTLYVPKGTVEAYHNAPFVWCDFPNILEECKIASIELKSATLNGTVGASEQLVATILPENASSKDLKFSSDNPDIASVNVDGIVNFIAKGTATVTATATDGSGISARCEVTVEDNSGLEDTPIDVDSDVRIYSSSGILLHEGKYSEADLSRGVYIIETKTGHHKKIIR